MALVARDKRLLRLPLLWQPNQASSGRAAKPSNRLTKTANAADTVTLSVADSAKANRWLDGR